MADVIRFKDKKDHACTKFYFNTDNNQLSCRECGRQMKHSKFIQLMASKHNVTTEFRIIVINEAIKLMERHLRKLEKQYEKQEAELERIKTERGPYQPLW